MQSRHNRGVDRSMGCRMHVGVIDTSITCRHGMESRNRIEKSGTKWCGCEATATCLWNCNEAALTRSVGEATPLDTGQDARDPPCGSQRSCHLLSAGARTWYSHLITDERLHRLTRGEAPQDGYA